MSKPQAVERELSDAAYKFLVRWRIFNRDSVEQLQSLLEGEIRKAMPEDELERRLNMAKPILALGHADPIPYFREWTDAIVMRLPIDQIAVVQLALLLAYEHGIKVGEADVSGRQRSKLVTKQPKKRKGSRS